MVEAALNLAAHVEMLGELMIRVGVDDSEEYHEAAPVGD